MEQTKDIFGKRLFEIREGKRESQQELADSIGITRQSLSRYELGERTANIDLLKKIAEHYHISADYLLGLTDNITTDKDLDYVSRYTGLNECTLGHIQMIEKEGYISTLNTLLTSFNMVTILENVDNALKVIDNFSNDTDMINDIFNEFIDNVTNNLFMKVTLSDKQSILIHLYTVCQLKYKDKVDYYHYKCQKTLDEAMQTHEMKLYDKVIKEMANRIYKMYLKYCEEVSDNGKYNPSEE